MCFLYLIHLFVFQQLKATAKKLTRDELDAVEKNKLMSTKNRPDADIPGMISHN